jgi:hypothetical protein
VVCYEPYFIFYRCILLSKEKKCFLKYGINDSVRIDNN